MNITKHNEIFKAYHTFQTDNRIEVKSFSYHLFSLWVTIILNGVKMDIEISDDDLERVLPFDSNVKESYLYLVYMNDEVRPLTFSDYFENVPNRLMLDFVAVHFVLKQQEHILLTQKIAA